MSTPVVVLTDTAAPAHEVVTYADQLAQALSVPLRLLHRRPGGPLAAAAHSLARPAYLRRRRVVQVQPVRTRVVLTEAALPNAVATIMAQQQALLLVLARPVEAAQAAATVRAALDLLHATGQPVLLLPLHTAPRVPPRRIVLATGGEPFILTHGLKALHALLLTLPAQLTVLHVNPGQRGYSGEDALHSVLACGLATRYVRPDLVELLAQSPLAGILVGVRRLAADMLVLAVRQRSFWQHQVPLSATAQLLQACPVPVLLLPAQGE